MIPSGLTSTSFGSKGARSIFAASGGKASVERPWKDRAQSTCLDPSSRIKGLSYRPSVRL